MSSATLARALPDLTPGGRLARIHVRGRSLQVLQRSVLSGELTVSMSEVTTLSLVFADPELVILESGLFRKGVPVTYGRRLQLVVTTRTIEDSSGVPQLTIEAMDRGAQKARHTRGELVRRDVSPSTYVAIGAKEAGLAAVVQPTGRRRHITRKGASKGQPAEDEYSVWQRLADDLGFVCFVVAGVVYFAQPTWLHKHLPAIDVDWRHDERVLGLPRATESANDPSQPVSLDLAVTDELADVLIPGAGARIRHLPTFEATYLVTETRVPLDDSQGCSVSAATPVNPEPAPKGGSSGAGGTATAAKFVNAALGEVGHGDPAPNPASPTGGGPLDGGELVTWAAEQAGASGVNTTPAGIWSQCDRAHRTVALAAGRKLRGVLLFKPGEVAVSLGDGRAIAAVGDHYAIVSASAGWTAAAKVPGVTY
jgi:hypothetical protein